MEVKKGSSVLLLSTVVAINSDDTFGSILSKVLTPEESEALRSLSVQMWESIIIIGLLDAQN